MIFCDEPIFLVKSRQRGGAVVARQAHNLEVAGASPAPATSQTEAPHRGVLVFCFCAGSSSAVHCCVGTCKVLRGYPLSTMGRKTRAERSEERRRRTSAWPILSRPRNTKHKRHFRRKCLLCWIVLCAGLGRGRETGVSRGGRFGKTVGFPGVLPPQQAKPKRPIGAFWFSAFAQGAAVQCTAVSGLARFCGGYRWGV